MKYIPYFCLVFVVYMLLTNVLKKSNIIPDDAIRVRVIANSNSDYDQDIKMSVKEIVSNDMYGLLKDTKGVSNARSVISDNLEYLNTDIRNFLEEKNYNSEFNINFGYNYFPEKKYKGVVYNEGYYESLVVTLGEGKGDNWWCVLFPPVCMIEAEESTDVEYTSLVNELFSKYF